MRKVDREQKLYKLKQIKHAVHTRPRARDGREMCNFAHDRVERNTAVLITSAVRASQFKFRVYTRQVNALYSEMNALW